MSELIIAISLAAIEIMVLHPTIHLVSHCVLCHT